MSLDSHEDDIDLLYRSTLSCHSLCETFVSGGVLMDLVRLDGEMMCIKGLQEVDIQKLHTTTPDQLTDQELLLSTVYKNTGYLYIVLVCNYA